MIYTGVLYPDLIQYTSTVDACAEQVGDTGIGSFAGVLLYL